MANVETKDGWIDLGFFKSIQCKKIMNTKVCSVKFTHGKLTLTEKELKKVCSK